LVLSGLYRASFKLALPFFLVLFFLCHFLLALLKIEVRFAQEGSPSAVLFDRAASPVQR
jgi:hypothetical protein